MSVSAASVSEGGDIVDAKTLNSIMLPGASKFYPEQFNNDREIIKKMIVDN